MRLFFALWPPPAAAHALAQWASETQRHSGGKTTDEAKIHLTLAFLGEADPERAIRAARGVTGAAHSLPIEEARYWRANSMVWAGPRHTPPALSDLVGKLHFELQKEKFVLERRSFAAHVTLIRKARPPKMLPPLPQVEWPVSEFVLVRSSLSPAGSSYQVLASVAL